MERIKSFSINHNVLEPGFYISRTDGDVITYDLRTRKPNAGDYMTQLAMHSVEHMMATFARNSEYKDSIVYFGPMGCATGFYLLVRDNVPSHEVFALTKKIMQQIIDHDGPVFGASAAECGNYRMLDIHAAKEEAVRYLSVLESQTNMEFTYPEA